jgi:hypothetical protein
MLIEKPSFFNIHSSFIKNFGNKKAAYHGPPPILFELLFKKKKGLSQVFQRKQQIKIYSE